MSVPSSSSAGQLDLPTRVRLRLKHGVRLWRDVSRYGRDQNLWWLLPAVLIMLMFAVAIVSSSAVVPVAVYTLF